MNGFQQAIQWLINLPVGVRRSMYAAIVVGAGGLLWSSMSESQTILFDDGSQYELKDGEKVYVSRSDSLVETTDVAPLSTGDETPSEPPVTDEPDLNDFPVGSDEWCAIMGEGLDGTLSFGQVYFDQYCTGA